MRLTTKNITPYLLDKGFLSTEPLMNGHYQLTQTQSRNCIFHVKTGAETGLFVKQLVQMDPQNVYLMQKDATMHHLLHTADFFEPLRAFVPDYHGYDPSKHVLVVENYSNAQNLFEYYNATKSLSAEDAVEIATILAHLHQDISEEIDSNTSLQFFNRDLPWILKITEIDFQNEPILQLAKQDELITREIHQLSQEWSGNTIMHGDIKFVNFLKVPQQDEALDLKLIDWEIANIGDPLWDVAGFFQSYISFWSFSQGTQATAQGMDATLWKLEQCKPCTSAFWKQYVQQQGWEEAEAEKQLMKAAKYTAARLLQTAKEANFLNPTQAQEHTVKVVQLAQNIFKNPRKAASDLLGI